MKTMFAVTVKDSGALIGLFTDEASAMHHFSDQTDTDWRDGMRYMREDATIRIAPIVTNL